jgi:polyhydroxyalkanoate synthesis regulator phasin
MNIKQVVDKIVADGKITHQEHMEFLTAVYQNGKIDHNDRQQVNRLIDLITRGEIKVE